MSKVEAELAPKRRNRRYRRRGPPKAGAKAKNDSGAKGPQPPTVYKKIDTTQKKNIQRKQAIQARDPVTPVTALVSAPGVQDTVAIETKVNTLSFNALPCGIVSYALAKGASNPYAIFRGIYEDILSILAGDLGTKSSRLAYLNQILGSLAPKTVPFRQTGKVAYTVQNPDITMTGPAMPIHGGKNYYMYIPGDTISFSWTLQDVPPSYDAKDVSLHYIAAMERLAGRLPHLKLLRDVQLGSEYMRDVSAYGRFSPYYGQGQGSGAPMGSVETEVPVKASMLGVLQDFDPSYPRVARKLHQITGDACSNYSIGAYDFFPLQYYQSAVPPIYKFLDLNELAFQLASAMLAAIKLQLKLGIDENNARLVAGFQFSWRRFLLMLRQHVIWNFPEQCIGQFLSPDTEAGSFQAFVCGSNCGPKQPDVILQIPQTINENLKMLRAGTYQYETKKLENPRNRITYIPVWGMFKGAGVEAPEFNYQYDGDTIFLFSAEEANQPDLWDGTLNGAAADLNNSENMTQVTSTWNDFLDMTRTQWTGITAMGGAGFGSPLLQFTRYVKFDVNSKTMEQPSPYLFPRAARPYVKKVETVLERKNSKKEIKTTYVFSPPGSTIFAERTQAVSGIIPITATHKEYLPLLILPVVEVGSADGLPDITEVQIGSQESYKVDFGKTATLDSLGMAYAAGDSNHVTGQAGKESAFGEYVKQLVKVSGGAFLGDLFSTIGNATGLPFLSTIGSVGNAIGI